MDAARIDRAVEREAGHLPHALQRIISLAVLAATAEQPDLRLTAQQRALVAYLRSRPGVVVSPSDLMQATGIRTPRCLGVQLVYARQRAPEMAGHLRQRNGGFLWSSP